MPRVPKVTIVVGSYAFQEVRNVSLRFSMREIADSFTATINDRGVTVDAGTPIGLAVDGVIRLIGEVQTVSLHKQAGVRDLTITGFSSAQRLVKSSLVVPVRTFSGQNLQSIVTQVVAPFGLVVDVSEAAVAAAAEVVEKARVGPGETAWGFLSKLAERQGCILVSGSASVLPENVAKASVRITQVATRRSPFPILYPSERVKSISYEDDVRSVHSQYFVNRRGKGKRNPTTGSLEALSGQAVDARVLYSPLIIQAKKGGNALPALQRQAEWEMRKRAAEGQRISVTYYGWSPNESQALWWPNTVYRITDTEEGVSADFLLASAELGEGPEGAEARLEFLPPDAYAVLGEPTITPGSRQIYRPNKAYLAQNAALVGSIAAASNVIDFDEGSLDLIYTPPDPNA